MARFYSHSGILTSSTTMEFPIIFSTQNEETNTYFNSEVKDSLLNNFNIKMILVIFSSSNIIFFFNLQAKLYFLLMADEGEVIEFTNQNESSDNILTRIKKFLSQGYHVNLVINKGKDKLVQQLTHFKKDLFKTTNQRTPNKTPSKTPNLSTNLQSRQESINENMEGSPLEKGYFIDTRKGPILSCQQVSRIDSYQMIPSPPLESLTGCEKQSAVAINQKLQYSLDVELSLQLEDTINSLNDSKEQLLKLEEIQKKINQQFQKKDLDKLLKKKYLILLLKCLIYQSKAYRKRGDLHKAARQSQIIIKIVVSLGVKITLKLEILKLMPKFFWNQQKLNSTINNIITLSISIKKHQKNLKKQIGKWKQDLFYRKLLQSMLYIVIYYEHADAKIIAYKALDICKEALPADDTRLANCYHDLGVVAFLNKEFEYAEQHLCHALVIKEMQIKKPLEKHSLADTLNYLGIVYHSDGSQKQAVESFSKALELLEFDKQIVTGQIWNNFALALIEEGQLIHAKKACEEAVNTFSQFHEQHHPLIHRAQRNKLLVRSLSISNKLQPK